jgi:hypothetical protein
MPESFGTITSYHNVISSHYDPQEFIERSWLVEEVARFRDDKDRRHLIIVGEPGSGKSTFLAYLAKSWNCPRHFIRVGSLGGVTGVDAQAFLVSIASQLYQKYGPDIFESATSGTTKVTVRSAKDQAEVIGRFVEVLYTWPFLPSVDRSVEVDVKKATGRSKVIGEWISQLVDVTKALDELDAIPNFV